MAKSVAARTFLFLQSTTDAKLVDIRSMHKCIMRLAIHTEDCQKIGWCILLSLNMLERDGNIPIFRLVHELGNLVVVKIPFRIIHSILLETLFDHRFGVTTNNDSFGLQSYRPGYADNPLYSIWLLDPVG